MASCGWCIPMAELNASSMEFRAIIFQMNKENHRQAYCESSLTNFLYGSRSLIKPGTHENPNNFILVSPEKVHQFVESRNDHTR
jgi:hypothetical protein